jgi:hypothetical protein
MRGEVVGVERRGSWDEGGEAGDHERCRWRRLCARCTCPGVTNPATTIQPGASRCEQGIGGAGQGGGALGGSTSGGVFSYSRPSCKSVPCGALFRIGRTRAMLRGMLLG